MLYFYKCTNCNSEIDKEMSMKDYTSEIECPYCGKIATKDYNRIEPLIYNQNFKDAFGRSL